MRNCIAILGCFLLISFGLNAQNIVEGVLTDAENGETLIGASVLVQELGNGAITDFDGNYRLDLKDGTYNLTFSYVGFTPQDREISVSGGSTTKIDIALKSDQFLEEVLIVADVAQEQKTPVAFTNVSTMKIKEELSAQDLPMVLNATPGAYATQQGGGEGDARVTIRGFNQRNIAVMLDGIPVNDMENGWVYWSNWFGLGAVTKTMQVQRGLGASKLAIPSVGGTINIVTKGIESKRNVNFKVEHTIFQQDFEDKWDDGKIFNKRILPQSGIFPKQKTQYTFGYNTGRLEKGWGVSVAGSYKHGSSYADATDFRAGFYYLRVDKEIGKKHMLSFSGFGAPQRHGQRKFNDQVQFSSKEYAAELFNGSDLEYQQFQQIFGIAYNDSLNTGEKKDLINGLDQQIFNFSNYESYDSMFTTIADYANANHYVDTIGVKDLGIRYNRTWGYQNYEINEDGDTTFFAKPRVFNTSVNYYHKPQFSLRHTWNPTNTFFMSNIVYTSIGKGGGTQREGSEFEFDPATYLLPIQEVFNSNVNARFGKPAGLSENILKSRKNEHFWIGFLNTSKYQITENWEVTGGVDFRYYKGDHYTEVYDLMGGDAFVYKGEGFSDTLSIGDRMEYDNTSHILWGGTFGLLEYSNEKWTAFINLSGAISSYKAVDNYYKQITLENDSTILVDLFRDNLGYNFNSPEAEKVTVDWVNLPSFTYKGGVSYRINKSNRVYANTSYMNKAARFQNVINTRSNYERSILMNQISNYKNEVIFGGEFGYNLKTPKFSLNCSVYATNWNNKPLDYNDLPSVRIDPTDLDSPSIKVNLNGLSSLHSGFEIETAYKPIKQLTIEGLVSIGNWKWNSNSSYFDIFENRTKIMQTDGLYVGDAAQTQLGWIVRVEPIKRFYIKLKGFYFARNYSDFSTTGLLINEGDPITSSDLQSWQIPNYYTMDAHLGYSFKINKVKTNVRFNILNLLNNTYISDATNNGNSTFGEFTAENAARSATVFFAPGIRFSTSLGISF